MVLGPFRLSIQNAGCFSKHRKVFDLSKSEICSIQIQLEKEIVKIENMES